jgi:hypothetical protein
MNINVLRRIVEFNTDILLFKKRNEMFGDEKKYKEMSIKYEWQMQYFNRFFPKIDAKKILIHPKDKIIDKNKTDIEYLKNYIYKYNEV